MKQDSPTPAACPKCGLPLSADAPRGLCTKCLFAAMLSSGPLDGLSSAPVGRTNLPRAFGSYELLEEVARGGMGLVYRARQTQINRIVAVKVIATGPFATPEFIERFRTEAESVASLDHPNIVPIYEVGDCEGQPFFSMRFVEGGSLAGRIPNRDAQASCRDSAGLLVKLARAVHHAHQRGILHRDIKPGNVLLDSHEEPQLTDFGLAKLVEHDSTLTRTTAMLGTPSYMSPEQARGEARKLTTSVDVYGLGAVFYELLTGQPPFAGRTTMETLRMVLEEDPRPPSDLVPAIDRDLETICLKCLEKDPANRYGSAEALATDLEHWQRHEPILARPPTTSYKLRKAWQRNTLAYSAATAAAFAVVLGLTLAAAAWWQVRKERDNALEARAGEEAQRREAVAARNHALQAQTIAAQQRDLAQERLYDSLVREARSIRTRRPLAFRRQLMDRIREAAAIPTPKRNPDLLRAEVAKGLGDAIGSDPVLLVDSPPSFLDAEVDSKGTLVAFSTAEGGLVLHETTTGTAVARLGGQGRLVRLAFTPEGQSLFGYAQEPGDAGAATPQPNSLVEWRRAGNGSWARRSERSMPNLRGLLATRRGVIALLQEPSPRGVRLVDAATDEWVGDVPAAVGGALPVAIDVSCDHRLVAYSSESGTNRASVEVWNVAAGRVENRLYPGLGSIRYLEFTPDSRFLACTTEGGVIIYETSRFELMTIFREYMAPAPAWSGDGSTLAVPLAQNNGISLLAVTSGTELARLTTRHQVRAVRGSLDGSVLLAVDYLGPMMIRLDGTPERVRLTGHIGGVPAVEFSPDGRRVASTGKDGTIRIWDVPTGRLLEAWGGQRVQGQTLCFSPDGRWLASGNYQNNQVLVRSIEDQRPVLALGDGGPGTLGTWSCAYSPDGRYLVAAGDGLRAWEIGSRTSEAGGSPLQARELFTEPGFVRNLLIHPAGRWIGFEATFERGGQVTRGSFKRGMDPRDEPELVDSHSYFVQTLGIDATSGTLLHMTLDRALVFRDPGSRETVRTLPTLAAGETASTHVGNLRVRPDGSAVAVVSHNGRGVNIHDLTSGRRLYTLPEDAGSVWWLAWHPDGTRLAVSRSDGEVSLWNLTEVEAVLAGIGLAR